MDTLDFGPVAAEIRGAAKATDRRLGTMATGLEAMGNGVI